MREAPIPPQHDGHGIEFEKGGGLLLPGRERDEVRSPPEVEIQQEPPVGEGGLLEPLPLAILRPPPEPPSETSEPSPQLLNHLYPPGPNAGPVPPPVSWLAWQPPAPSSPRLSGRACACLQPIPSRSSPRPIRGSPGSKTAPSRRCGGRSSRPTRALSVAP